MITLSLPTPPSTNALYRNVPGKGRVKTYAYIMWKQHAQWTIASQVRPAQRIAGPFAVTMRVPMRGDADNRAKAALDALKGLVTDDDAACMSIAITKEPGRKDCLLTVAPFVAEENPL
jgi:Holliday junction resolvase RusA-like endonuclease